jgi:hypothetical protein
VPRQRDMDLERVIEETTIECGMNPDPDFVLKVV